MLDYLHNKNFDKELMNLVYSIAFNYKNSFVDFDDLIQEGFLGLAKAYKNFNPQRNVLFTTYAYYWIKKQILEYIKKNKKFNNTNFDDIEIEKLSYEEKFAQTEDINNEVNFKKQDFDNLEQKVLDLSFNKKYPLDKIAKELNLKREKIRQIQAKALRKIKINKNLTESLLKVNY